MELKELLNLFRTQGGKYLSDILPGGLLNEEWTPERVRTAAEVGSMEPGLLGSTLSGLLAVDDARKGDYGSAALNAVGLLPFVPGVGGTIMESRKWLKPMKKAGETVDGRTVTDSVKNISSVGSSLDDYAFMKGIREVPMDMFTQGKPAYYSAAEEARTKQLAEKIRQSGWLDPLIVAVDKQGPYILEGGHRFDALRELGAKSLPAKVVLDLEAFR